jgi:hypothetical protein
MSIGCARKPASAGLDPFSAAPRPRSVRRPRDSLSYNTDFDFTEEIVRKNRTARFLQRSRSRLAGSSTARPAIRPGREQAPTPAATKAGGLPLEMLISEDE